MDRLFADFRPEVVVHTAASYKDPNDWESDALVNCAGTAIVAKACKTHKVRRLIYFQTALCYGTKPLQTPIRLDHPINPVNSSYAISKTAGEQYVQFSGVNWVTFRLANVIGPRNVSGPLPIFFERLSSGRQVHRDRGAARLLFCRRFGGCGVAGNRRERRGDLPLLQRQGCGHRGALPGRRARHEAQPLSGTGIADNSTPTMPPRSCSIQHARLPTSARFPSRRSTRSLRLRWSTGNPAASWAAIPISRVARE